MNHKENKRTVILVGKNMVFILLKSYLVKFLELEYNIGGGYDITRDRFVCDVNGSYFFAVTLVSDEPTIYDFTMNVTLFQKSIF